ncbi:YtxH domain-containing protein [Bacillus sp. BRMEA1]|uniref:YtxH domain-containing protein n=1 Tax=Neobacillus endophyticus TaxID=2738405 RepID=UPI001567BE07|nr:YtxH domain-containing protein [Neobacillus endophyticus]NRD76146.1 YtxH domain-containing protein [Neobacillus endophyticus]
MANRENEKQEIYQSSHEETSNSFLLGAIIGGVVGAVTALLLAPKPGNELRRSLSSQAGTIFEKTEQVRDNVRVKSNNLVSKTADISQGIVLQSTGLINKVKGKAVNQNDPIIEQDSGYISIASPKKPSSIKTALKGTLDGEEIRKKLEEAQKAFEEEEQKVK